MPPTPLVVPAQIDTSTILYDIEAIRRGNPQRFEMEQLTAVVQVDKDHGLIVGYKDILPDEFWVRGHLPGDPIMPGALICEAAAQLCSFFCYVTRRDTEGFLAFGGLEDVRFRGPTRIGDRLLIVGKAVKIRRRQQIFETQAFVGLKMVFQGRIIGMPLQELS